MPTAKITNGLPLAWRIALPTEANEVSPATSSSIEIDSSIIIVAVAERIMYLKAPSRALMSRWKAMRMKDETAVISMKI